MTLNHVYFFDGKNWKKTTASKVSEKASASISAKSGLFRCNLCGQKVTYVYSDVKTPYFKHVDEENKNCPDRVTGNSNVVATYRPKDYYLPLKIKIVSNTVLSFYIGFLPLPEDLLKDNINNKIYIERLEDDRLSVGVRQYNFTNLYLDKVKYLKVGNDPSLSYKISTKDRNDIFQKYWPSKVQGIIDYALFHRDTGIRISRGADVRVGKEYLLLTRFSVKIMPGIKIEKLVSANFDWIQWNLFSVKANEFSKNTVEFFLNYSYRLVEREPSLQPIWPEFNQQENIIFHEKDYLYFYYEGSGILKSYPGNNIKQNYLSRGSINSKKLLKVNNTNGQQILSIGKINVLDYVYLRNTSGQYIKLNPKAIVRDLKNEFVNEGNYESLPKKEELNIIIPYDGYIQRTKYNLVTSIEKVKANQSYRISNIEMDETIEVFVGLDCVWKAVFTKGGNKDYSDRELFNRLRISKGREISISHSFGSIASKMRNYPLSKMWLYKQVKRGKINRDARELLLNLFIRK